MLAPLCKQHHLLRTSAGCPAAGHLLRTGQHRHVKGVNMLGKCKRLQVRPADEGALLAWECDGEFQGDFGAVDIRVLPAALRLLSGKPAT